MSVAKPKVRNLRERKKAQQRQDLLDSAAELFRSSGFEETRMEDIAVHADVSTKTVYNYFPTKQRILVELLRQDRESLIEVYDAVAQRRPDDLAEALAQLIRADVGEIRSVEDKKLWRELLAAETRAHDRMDDEFQINRQVFLEYIERILVIYRDRGQLSREVSLPLAVEMVYAINAYDFRRYCATARATPETVLELARSQMKLLVSAWQ